VEADRCADALDRVFDQLDLNRMPGASPDAKVAEKPADDG
jgi:hypothetical protein